MKLSIVSYLTICLIEECAEIIQRACKALRFGWYEKQPGQIFDNVDRLCMEYSDLQGVIQMLRERKIDIRSGPIHEHEKKVKVREFMKVSHELGIIDYDDK